MLKAAILVKSTHLIKLLSKTRRKEKYGKKFFFHKSPSKRSFRHRIHSLLRRAADVRGSADIIYRSHAFEPITELYLWLKLMPDEQQLVQKGNREKRRQNKPDRALTYFIEDRKGTCINNLITDLCSHNKVSNLILGDFNYHITWSSDNVEAIDPQSKEFLEVIRKNSLTQHIRNPTRSRGTNEPSILDLVLSDGNFISDIDYLSPLGKSDHSVLKFSCIFFVFRSESNLITPV